MFLTSGGLFVDWSLFVRGPQYFTANLICLGGQAGTSNAIDARRTAHAGGKT